LRVRVLKLLAILVITCAVTVPSAAQFGRLKSLAKEKLGIPEKKEQKQEESQPAKKTTKTTEAPVADSKEPPPPPDNPTPGKKRSTASPEPRDPGYVEVKAVLPAGTTIKPSMEVRRKRGATPEVTMLGKKRHAPGSTAEITYKLVNLDATGIAAVRAHKPCNTVTDFRVVSPTEVKITLKMPDQQYGSTCSLEFRAEDGAYLTYAQLEYMGKDSWARHLKEEEQRREAALPAAERAKLARQRMGKVWAVEFADGGKDTWTLLRAESNGMSFTFKNGAGKVMQVLYSGGTVSITNDNCMMQASVEAGNADGMTVGECGTHAMGTKWTARIQ